MKFFFNLVSILHKCHLKVEDSHLFGSWQVFAKYQKRVKFNKQSFYHLDNLVFLQVDAGCPTYHEKRTEDSPPSYTEAVQSNNSSSIWTTPITQATSKSSPTLPKRSPIRSVVVASLNQSIIFVLERANSVHTLIMWAKCLIFKPHFSFGAKPQLNNESDA